MKNKILFFLAISAVVTLSFTFSAVKDINKSEAKVSSKAVNDEPAGGFVLEDKF